MIKKYSFVLISTLFFITDKSYSQESTTELLDWLKSIIDVEIVSKLDDKNFAEVYEIFIIQPVDHNNQNGLKFKQQIFLSHTDKNKPVIIDFDGYAATNHLTELTKLLSCNQIIVEHRYYGESVPSPFVWKYLNIEQAANDQHRIIELFKQFYKSKWISTGISKGGSCVVFHRYFYPFDVDVSVSYVGPLNYSTEDQRVYEWIKSVSTPECREKVFTFQKLCLEKKDDLYPLFLEAAKNKKRTYEIAGYEKAFEYSILEYSFAYWQWSDGDCSKIPTENSSLKEIWDHLAEFGGVTYFDDSDIVSIQPFYYQCYTEYGYYAYEVNKFKDFLKYADGKTHFFIPPNSNPTYDPGLLQNINYWASNEGEKFIYIYGGNDPWSSTGVCLTGKTNSIKMVLPNGSHRSRIKDFSNHDKEIIYSKLETWLEIQIER